MILITFGQEGRTAGYPRRWPLQKIEAETAQRAESGIESDGFQAEVVFHIGPRKIPALQESSMGFPRSGRANIEVSSNVLPKLGRPNS